MVFRGVAVQGEMRLLKTGSYKANPGIVLFRHNRVIEGTSRAPFIPVKLLSTSNKYGRQRVYGELHLDDLPVSYTKDKFEMDEDEFVIALQALPGIPELLKQASEFRQDQSKIVKVKSEKALIAKVGKARAAKASAKSASAGSEKQKAGKRTASQSATTSKSVVPPVVQVLNSCKSGTASLLLQTLIEETISQYQSHRSVGAALCLRIVIEVGMLYKIERSFPSQYPKISHLGIKALLTHMKNHPKDFFTSADYRVEKCIGGNATGSQNEIVLLNNVAHGHYHPDLNDIDRCVINMQAAMEWAYS